MSFTNYLEDENDKPYFTTNSLSYYYDKMEGFAKAVEGSAKALNLTKEEVEKRITFYIEQNKNELDQRLAQWDGKLETFDSSVETLLSEWVDDGTMNHVIDSSLIDQRIAPVTALLAETEERATVERATIGVNRKIKRKVLPPVGFNWQDAPITIYKNPIGEFSTDFDVSKFQHVGAGKTYYVDFANGIDTNDGLTLSTALKSLRTAMQKTDVDIVLIAGGVIDATGLFDASDFISRTITIKAVKGADVTLSVHANASWELTSGQTKTYQANRTLLGRVFDSKFIDENGDYRELVKRNSIAEVESNPNSYYYASNVVYVHTSDGRVPDNSMRLYLNDRAGLWVRGTGKLYLEGIKIHGGLSSIRVTSTATELYPEVYGKNCEFKYPCVSNAIDVRCAKYAFFQNCLTAKAIDDGFNYHGAFGEKPLSIEVDCVGRDNGVSSDTDNGSTTHDGGKAIRVNCQYYRNKGSNVGDIDEFTQSWNLGVSSFNSLSPLENRYKSNFTAHDNAEIWLDGCASFESLNAAVAQNNAKLNYRDSILDGEKFTEGTGQILTY